MKLDSIGSRKASTKAQKKPLGLIIGLALAVVVLGVGGWYYYNNASPERVLARFLAASESGNKDAIKALLSSKSQEMMGKGFDNMIEIQNNQQNKSDAPNYTIGEATINEGVATVPVSISLDGKGSEIFGKSSMDIKYALVKEGLFWRVDLEATAKSMMDSIKDLMPDMENQGAPMPGR